MVFAISTKSSEAIIQRTQTQGVPDTTIKLTSILTKKSKKVFDDVL